MKARRLVALTSVVVSPCLAELCSPSEEINRKVEAAIDYQQEV